MHGPSGVVLRADDAHQEVISIPHVVQPPELRVMHVHARHGAQAFTQIVDLRLQDGRTLMAFTMIAQKCPSPADLVDERPVGLVRFPSLSLVEGRDPFRHELIEFVEVDVGQYR